MLGRLFRVDDMFKGRRHDRRRRRNANATVQYSTRPLLEEPQEPEVEIVEVPVQEQASTSSAVEETLEDAQKMIKRLRQRTKNQAQQLLSWKRAHKMQEFFIARLQREKNDQVQNLSAKLLLFQSRLIRKQKDISSLLKIRERIIQRQKNIIEDLTTRLTENGLEVPPEVDTNLPDLPDIESLNDSDSAVIMEDLDSDCGIFNLPKFRPYSEGTSVVRSISDAIDPYIRYGGRRNNSYLRRPEVLETVYSVEEDGDESQSEEKTEADAKREAFARAKSTCNVVEPDDDVQQNCAVEEKVCEVPTIEAESRVEDDADRTKPSTSGVKTYNRVMCNHRSVTKPKDVKYKRINKAKSKSLEELRGRLKNWVDNGGNKLGMGLEHSQSYA